MFKISHYTLPAKVFFNQYSIFMSMKKNLSTEVCVNFQRNFKIFSFIIFNYVHVCICLWVCIPEYRCMQRPEVLDTPKLGLIGSCNLPSVGFGIEINFSRKVIYTLNC